MKTTVSILCVIIGTIALPIGIIQIIEGYRVLLFSILCILLLPGYINSLSFLHKKYNW